MTPIGRDPRGTGGWWFVYGPLVKTGALLVILGAVIAYSETR